MVGNNSLKFCTEQLLEIIQFWVDAKVPHLGRVSAVKALAGTTYEIELCGEIDGEELLYEEEL